MAEPGLPQAFRDLEPWMPWSLETERERSEKRQASSMEEIRGLYDAVLPRMDEALTYLDQYPLDAMPTDARRLLLLTLSLAEVAPAVELFGQPRVPDSYDAARFTSQRRD